MHYEFQAFLSLKDRILKNLLFSLSSVGTHVHPFTHVVAGALSTCLVCWGAWLYVWAPRRTVVNPIWSYNEWTSKDCRDSLGLLIRAVLPIHTVSNFGTIWRNVKYNPRFSTCETVYWNILHLRDITRVTYTQHFLSPLGKKEQDKYKIRAPLQNLRGQYLICVIECHCLGPIPKICSGHIFCNHWHA